MVKNVKSKCIIMQGERSFNLALQKDHKTEADNGHHRRAHISISVIICMQMDAQSNICDRVRLFTSFVLSFFRFPKRKQNHFVCRFLHYSASFPSGFFTLFASICINIFVSLQSMIISQRKLLFLHFLRIFS